jgi:LysR family transcriptional regulator, carnitine catabolism transcriptional activator
VLVETQAFTQAASRLGTSQSNLSALISELESNLGSRLFDRHTRKVIVTQTAMDLLPDIKRILDDLDNLLAGAVGSEKRSTVRIATVPSLAIDLLPRIVKDFSETHPNIKLEVLDVQRPELFGAVRSGLADFGIALGLNTPSDLQAQTYLKQEFMVVMLPDHPLADQDVVVWPDLIAYPLIGPSADQTFHAMLANRLRQHGEKLNLLYEVIHQTTVLGLAAQGLGVGFAYASMQRLSQSFGLVQRRLAEPSVEYEFAIVSPRSRPLSYAASLVRGVLLQGADH